MVRVILVDVNGAITKGLSFCDTFYGLDLRTERLFTTPTDSCTGLGIFVNCTYNTRELLEKGLKKNYILTSLFGIRLAMFIERPISSKRR